MIKNILTELYCSILKCTTLKNLIDVAEAIIRSGSAITSTIARDMGLRNKKTFSANIKSISRLLNDGNFQVDDSFFRKLIKIIFHSMNKENLLKKGDNLQINVDFTSSTDDFLILVASVKFHDRAIPLYFSTRIYAKRKDQYNQIKMEKAFINELRHLLPKKYTYTIVADRGFGNLRFAEYCESAGFSFVLRLNDNLNVKINGEKKNLKDFSGQTTSFDAYVSKWKKNFHFEVKTKNGSTWFLLMPLNASNGATKYEQRFSIEKCFQDQKSSGFDIENSKIRKYPNFRRLYALVCLAQIFTVICGEYIQTKKKDLLKRITNNRKRVLSIFQIGAFFCQRMFSEIEEIVKSIFREFLPLEKNGVR